MHSHAGYRVHDTVYLRSQLSDGHRQFLQMIPRHEKLTHPLLP